MKKFHEIALFAVLGIIFFLSSCTNKPSLHQDDLQSFIYNEFQLEEDRILEDEVIPKLDKLQADYMSNQQRKTDAFTRTDSINTLYDLGLGYLDNSEAVLALEKAFMKLRFNYTDFKGKYSVEVNPFTKEGLNPDDSLDFKLSTSLFSKISNTDIPIELRKLYFTQITILTLNYFANKLDLPDCSFHSIKFGVNAPHKIWFQNEKAYITVGYYEDLNPFARYIALRSK